MTGKLETLFARIPWRLLVTVLGGALVVNGGDGLLSAELPAASEEVIQAIRRSIEFVIVGGVVLIAAIMSR